MKSGFISIIGRPNAGKSTLLNEILDRKIAITSDKPQTTRVRITGIYTDEEAQMVFVDTPGIHKPKHKLGSVMVDVARESIYDGDVIYYVVDASVPFGGGEAFILKALETARAPVFLLLNKTDTMAPEAILQAIVQWNERRSFAEIFPMSALTGDNVEALLTATKNYLPEGLPFYPADEITDQPEKVLMAELIREKILRLTNEEVPHSVAVVIEGTERRERDDKLVVYGLIYVERATQKRILIGKNGQMMKKIGTAARLDIEHLVGEEIDLKLWVKVKEAWRNHDSTLHDLGLDQRF